MKPLWWVWPVNSYGSVPVPDGARHRRILLLCAIGHGVVLAGVAALVALAVEVIATAPDRAHSPSWLLWPALVGLAAAQLWLIGSARATRAAVAGSHADVDALASVLRRSPWPAALLVGAGLMFGSSLLFVPVGSPIHVVGAMVTTTAMLLVLAQLTSVYRCVTGSGRAHAPIPAEIVHRMHRNGPSLSMSAVLWGVLVLWLLVVAALPSSPPAGPQLTALRIGLAALVVGLPVPLVLTMYHQRRGIAGDRLDPARMRRAAEFVIGYAIAAAVVVPISVLGSWLTEAFGAVGELVRFSVVWLQLILAVSLLSSASSYHIGHVPITSPWVPAPQAFRTR